MVRKAHVKLETITETTLRRYNIAVGRFFGWRRSCNLSVPASLAALDFQAGEFIHFLYLDGRPLGWAGDFVSGLKRLFQDAESR